jgi:Spy/CpxP family protein refolding chaperone
LADKRSWTAILIAVAAGLLIGFTASTLAYRYRLIRVPRLNAIERLDRDVHLSPEQRAKVFELMGQSRVRIDELRRDYRRKRRAVFAETYRSIREVLTAKQQADFDRTFPPPRALLQRAEPQTP